MLWCENFLISGMAKSAKSFSEKMKLGQIRDKIIDFLPRQRKKLVKSLT
jgi:hypothetical protein